MSKRVWLVVLFVLVSIVFSGCLPRSVVVEKSLAQDWIWGTEILGSGASRVWFRYDNIAGYCTSDPDLAQKVIDLMGEEVEFSFKTKRPQDDESWNRSGCARLSTGTDSSTPIFKLTCVEIVGGEETCRPKMDSDSR